ncbi:MAG: type II secretion system major pseudopilin GspG [Planctomycetota bacterium]|jgi:general secretion pathway protein G
MKLRHKQSTPRSGFSLAELMVVIVIIGLLVGVVAPNVLGYLFRGQEARVKIDLNAIGNAIENYALDNGGRPPESLDQLVEPNPDTGEAYLKGSKIPVDPWGFEYQYEPPFSSGESFRLYSFGEDGQIGGVEKARDLTYEWATGQEETE